MAAVPCPRHSRQCADGLIDIRPTGGNAKSGRDCAVAICWFDVELTQINGLRSKNPHRRGDQVLGETSCSPHRFTVIDLLILCEIELLGYNFSFLVWILRLILRYASKTQNYSGKTDEKISC